MLRDPLSTAMGQVALQAPNEGAFDSAAGSGQLALPAAVAGQIVDVAGPRPVASPARAARPVHGAGELALAAPAAGQIADAAIPVAVEPEHPVPQAPAAGQIDDAAGSGHVVQLALGAEPIHHAVAPEQFVPSAPAAGPAPALLDPQPVQILQHLTALLEGRDLTAISVGALRRDLAARMGLEPDALDHKRDEIKRLTEEVVHELGNLPDWVTPINETARLMVYLVTLSAILPDTMQEHGVPLRNPSDLSREQVRDAVLDAVANPAQEEGNSRRGRPRTRKAEVMKLIGCKEPHVVRSDSCHHHVALKLSFGVAFKGMKLALRQRHGLASHWSTSHTMLWSAVRYMTFPSEKKPFVDASPLTWTPDGKVLNLYEEAQEPYCPFVNKRRREANAMKQPETAAKKAKPVEKFGKLDLTSLILAERLMTPAQVIAFAQTKGSVVMQTYINRQQRRLKEMIEDAFAWEAAQQAAATEKEKDWDLVVRLSKGVCECGDGGCAWWAAASEFFARNAEQPGVLGVDRQLLAASLRNVIQRGPSKIDRVPLLVGPSNSGKSTVLDPVREVFGPECVFNKPKLGAPCPLSKLPRGKRFVYFDDFRPVEYAALPKDNPTVSVTTFLAMFQGQPFDIQVSQSFNDGHPELVWRRGAAMTAKHEGLWQQMGMVSSEDIRHMQSRVVQFTAYHVIPLADFAPVPLCKESWARWVVTDSLAYAARPAPRPAPRLRQLQVPDLPMVDEEESQP